MAEEYAFNVAMKYKTEKYAPKLPKKSAKAQDMHQNDEKKCKNQKYAPKKTKKSANLKNMPQNQYQRLKT